MQTFGLSDFRRHDRVDSLGILLAALGFVNPLLAAFMHVTSELTFILKAHARATRKRGQLNRTSPESLPPRQKSQNRPFQRLSSRVTSSRPLFGRLGLPPMMFDPQLGEPIELV